MLFHWSQAKSPKSNNSQLRKRGHRIWCRRYSRCGGWPSPNQTIPRSFQWFFRDGCLSPGDLCTSWAAVDLGRLQAWAKGPRKQTPCEKTCGKNAWKSLTLTWKTMENIYHHIPKGTWTIWKLHCKNCVTLPLRCGPVCCWSRDKRGAHRRASLCRCFVLWGSNISNVFLVWR